MTVANRRIAVYPGTFDPITNGHIDLVNRAAPLFEKVVVGVAQSPSKGPTLPLELRVQLARGALSHHDNVEVIGFDTLLAHFVRSVQGGILLRHPHSRVAWARHGRGARLFANGLGLLGVSAPEKM